MREAEPLGRFGSFEMVRWRDPALPADLAALVAEAEAGGIAWMAEFSAAWQVRPYLDPGEGLFLARDDSTPVAMAVISADPYVADGTTGRLRYIYVGHRARGRGLLRAFVELALARGHGRWRRLRLHTDNPVAARVYESYGFVATAFESRSTHLRDRL